LGRVEGEEKEESYMERGVFFLTKPGFQKWDLLERGA